jgi:hypothetical protein
MLKRWRKRLEVCLGGSRPWVQAQEKKVSWGKTVRVLSLYVSSNADLDHLSHEVISDKLEAT